MNKYIEESFRVSQAYRFGSLIDNLVIAHAQNSSLQFIQLDLKHKLFIKI